MSENQSKKGCAKRRRPKTKGVLRHRNPDRNSVGMVGDGSVKWYPAVAQARVEKVLAAYDTPDE